MFSPWIYLENNYVRPDQDCWRVAKLPCFSHTFLTTPCNTTVSVLFTRCLFSLPAWQTTFKSSFQQSAWNPEWGGSAIYFPWYLHIGDTNFKYHIYFKGSPAFLTSLWLRLRLRLQLQRWAFTRSLSPVTVIDLFSIKFPWLIGLLRRPPPASRACLSLNYYRHLCMAPEGQRERTLVKIASMSSTHSTGPGDEQALLSAFMIRRLWNEVVSIFQRCQHTLIDSSGGLLSRPTL